MTPEQFVAKWLDAKLSERQGAQSHWNDLCAMLQRPKPAELDQTGDTYCFEKGTRKSGGGTGWADVWFKDKFAVEYKGPKEKDLTRAYDQLQRYHDWLERPPLLIVTDTRRFEVHTKFTRTAPRVYRFTIEDFLTGDPVPVDTTEDNPPGLSAIQILRLAFDDPDRLKPTLTTDRVTQDASANFATIAQSMRDRGIEPHAAAHFLMKVLFCLFAEDVGLLPDKLFARMIKNERNNPDELRQGMEELFSAMRDGRRFGAQRIKHFNGALFDHEPAMELTRDEIAALLVASRLDWAHVEPSIFGTLFERSLDPSQRSQLGAHYTGFEDIMLVVEPVILRPLKREWDALRQRTEPLLAEINELRDTLASLPQARGRAKQGSERGKAERRFKKLRDEVDAEYTRLLDRLRDVRILDPACGSGNFLYVALAQLKDLEKQVIQEAYGLRLDLAGQNPLVDPSQLYGIEINPYAHELAQVVVWIGYIQWHVRNSYSFPENPILKPLTNIRRMDALLGSAGVPPAPGSAGVSPAPAVGVPPTATASETDAGHAGQRPALPTRPDWPEAEFIIGNPPFLGDKKMRAGLGDEYVEALRKAYEGDVAGGADLSVYWHERARALIEQGKVKRAGLLATQGIRGGASQRTLKRILETGNIFEAWSDKRWTVGGAAVQISIVCQDEGAEHDRRLNGHNVDGINADLTGSSEADLSTAFRLSENEGLAFIGGMKKGKFELSDGVAKELLRSGGNPNNKPNSDVIRPWVNGRDVTGRPQQLWIIDFGERTEAEAACYEAAFEYVRKHVKPKRDAVRNQRERTHWWLHARSAPDLRRAIEGLASFIGTARVAKHRLFVRLPSSTCPDGQVVVFAREDDYFFGVLHSAVHERWALRLGTQLREKESGFRYTPTTCFETFPFPWPPRDVGVPPADADETAAFRQAIAAAARELNELRENWLNPQGVTEAELKKRTLTNLYNKRPEWLHLAHQKLDEAVLAAYGWQDINAQDLTATHRPNPGETPEQAKARQSVAEEDMLSRLLALNLERAEQ